jgi:hypothetical protein
MSYDTLRPLLEKLHFKGMLAHLDELVSLDQIKPISDVGLLKKLLEMEIAHRQTRSLAYPRVTHFQDNRYDRKCFVQSAFS